MNRNPKPTADHLAAVPVYRGELRLTAERHGGRALYRLSLWQDDGGAWTRTSNGVVMSAAELADVTDALVAAAGAIG